MSKNRKTGYKNTVFDNRITENVDYKNWYEYGWCYICVQLHDSQYLYRDIHIFDN